jgi:phosphoenolpyruvate carboxykinase (ATP)
MLDTRNTWSNPSEYDMQAKKLAVLFHENFEQFKAQTPQDVIRAGPKIGQ